MKIKNLPQCLWTIIINFFTSAYKFLKDLTPLISAISIILSIILAFKTLNSSSLSRKLNEQQYRLNKISQENEIKRQANDFAIWRIEKPKKYSNINDPLMTFFEVKNTSKLPVYDVIVLAVRSAKEVNLSNIEGLYNKNETSLLVHNRNPDGDINDDESGHFAFQETVSPGETIGSLEGRGQGWGKIDAFVYFFRDASGRTWFRSNMGSLSRISKKRLSNLLINIGIDPTDIASPMTFKDAINENK